MIDRDERMSLVMVAIRDQLRAAHAEYDKGAVDEVDRMDTVFSTVAYVFWSLGLDPKHTAHWIGVQIAAFKTMHQEDEPGDEE